MSGTYRARLHHALVGTRPGLVGLSLIIGVGAGLGAVAFRYLIVGITWLVTGREDFSDAGRVASDHLPWLGVGFLVLAPVVGGLVYGPLVNRFAPEARGHGVPEVMYAVARNGGRIPPRVAAVKAFASAVCIGTGGSVGREGPIVQIGSALGSSIGQWLRVPSHRLVLMVACGAAGGISATFNAPIAGVVFALELILREFTAEAFGVLVLSSVTANVVARSLVGDDTILHLPHFDLGSPAELPLYAVLGVVAGLIGWGFARFLYLVEDACDHVWRGPEWLRPAVGGLLLGGLLLALPQMYGVGYPVLQDGITGGYALGFLLLLAVGKMVATSLTIGIGGSGGVFAPSLFVGGMSGDGVRARGARAAARPGPLTRRVRAGRDGRRVRRGRARPDHGRPHRVRADRELRDHPAADGDGGPGHGRQPLRLPGEHLHAQARPPRGRHPVRTRRRPDVNAGLPGRHRAPGDPTPRRSLSRP